MGSIYKNKIKTYQ